MYMLYSGISYMSSRLDMKNYYTEEEQKKRNQVFQSYIVCFHSGVISQCLKNSKLLSWRKCL